MRPFTPNQILAIIANQQSYGRSERAAIARDTYAINVANWASEMLENLDLSPRLIFKWATDHEHFDLEQARERTAELGEAASPDLCNAQRWVHQILDWCATHMVVNMGVCFRCEYSHKVVGQYGGFPLCERCFKDMEAQKEAAREPIVRAATEEAKEIIKAVFAQIPISPLTHLETCKQPKVKHTHYISTPTGWLKFDRSTCFERHEAQLWTKAEVAELKILFGPISLEVFRVVKA